MNYYRLYITLFLSLALFSCGEKQDATSTPIDQTLETEPEVIKEYGYVLDDYVVERDTVQSGDSFGKILFDSNVDYATIQEISDSVKNVFDTRRIRVGKPYMLLKSKDTLEAAQVFIYEQNKEDYVVVDFEDDVTAAAKKHPVTIVEREVSGVISSNLSSTFDDLGASVLVSIKMADIYAWTIDFNKLDVGDRFKVIYDERYVNDTVAAGVGNIKACVF